MEVFKNEDKNKFTLQTSLSYEEYKIAENMFEKNNLKNYFIYHNKKFVDKLQLLYELDQETCHLFQKEDNFNLEIPENSNPHLIPPIIHYLYFKEVQGLPFGEIVNFLDLAIFFQIKDLFKKIVNFLKGTIDTTEKAVFLRFALFPLTKRAHCHISDSLQELLFICDVFLLNNNKMKEYISLYNHECYSLYIDCSDIERELLNGLDLMTKYKKNGKYMLKLLALFQDRLCVLKSEKNDFDFKDYAEKIILKYIKLEDVNSTSLIKSFSQLGLNLNDFKIDITNEKVDDLKNEVKNLKEILRSLSEVKNDDEVNCDQKVQEQKNRQIIEMKNFKCLHENEYEEERRKRRVPTNIIYFIGAILFCIIFNLKNDGEQQNVFELKKIAENKYLFHRNEIENNLETIEKKLQTLEKTIEKEQKEYQEKLLALKQEYENELEKVKEKQKLLHELIEKEQKEREQNEKEQKEKEQKEKEQKEKEQKEKEQKEKEKEQKEKEQKEKEQIEKEQKEKEQKEKEKKEKEQKKKEQKEKEKKEKEQKEKEQKEKEQKEKEQKEKEEREKEQKEKEEREKEQKEKEEKEKEKEKNWKEIAQKCLKEKDEKGKNTKDSVIAQLQKAIQTIHEDHEKHFQYLAELLEFKTTNQLLTNLRLLFRASEQEPPLASKFHKLCDSKGPTITIVRSKEHKKLFGGYSSKSWKLPSDAYSSPRQGYSYASGSFLFSLDKQTKHTLNKNRWGAIYGNAEYGPTWGGFEHDLCLSTRKSRSSSTDQNWSNLGNTYLLPKGINYGSKEAKSYLAGSYYFEVEEYEVFEVINYKKKGKSKSKKKIQ